MSKSWLINDQELPRQEAEGLVRATLDALIEPIVILDEDVTILHVNKAWRDFHTANRLSISEDDIGANYLALCQESGSLMPDAQRMAEGIHMVIEGKTAEFSLEFTSNEQRWYVARVTRFQGDGVLRLIVTHEDITEHKYVESQSGDKERLNLALDKERELRDLKNRLISMISHELRTPLAAIRLANDMLKMYGDQSTPEEKRESYEAIDQQVAYLNELVSDVMTLSRTDFTGVEFEAQLVDLETYCRDIIEEISLAYHMKRRINFSGTNTRVEATIDPKLLRHALTNLLTNAIKYSPEDKAIDVSLSLDAKNNDAIIRVSDQGIGISKDDFKHLFDPFFRADNVGQIQGTGLGLPIAKQAIELHGGSLTVESTVGVGTTFTVCLPLPEKKPT